LDPKEFPLTNTHIDRHDSIALPLLHMHTQGNKHLRVNKDSRAVITFSTAGHYSLHDY